MRTYSLRPARDSDRDWVWETKKLCFSVYVKQAYGVWNEETQTARFMASFESKEIQIIRMSEVDVGYVSFECREKELQLFNIMILPDFQNQGLGSAVMKKLQAMAKERNLPLKLQVLKVNPARKLYERLGFAIIGQTDTHDQMQWTSD